MRVNGDLPISDYLTQVLSAWSLSQAAAIVSEYLQIKVVKQLKKFNSI